MNHKGSTMYRQQGTHSDPLRRFTRHCEESKVGAIKDQINEFLAKMKPKLELDVQPVYNRDEKPYESLFEFGIYTNRRGENSANLLDMGFGFSQAIPILLEFLLSEPLTTILVEQPELHSQNTQANLGDFFVQEANRHACLLLETHSEQFVLRLQKRVRQHQIEPANVFVAFVSREGGISRCRQLRLDVEGDFIDAWPVDFADLRYIEVFE